jgi:hypothetical protein
LALLGLEEAGDFKFLNNAHLTKIANFLEVVPQGKFRRALNIEWQEETAK